MALNVIEGMVGAGKTYVAVHRWMKEFLLGSERPIFTNLPLRVDAYVAWLTEDVALQSVLRERIQFLEDVWVFPDKASVGPSGKVWTWPLDENTGKPLEVELSPLDRKRGWNPITHFWRFTPSNAVVILDEVADHWNSTIWKELSEGELGSFVNHHRHYKYDLFFFCQNKDDIATPIRKKIDYSWLVENSLRRNMFDWWVFRGLKWPVQFFYVRMDIGQVCFGMPYLRRTAHEPQQNFIVWPKCRGFLNYDSFCESSKLHGKKVASDEARSGDMPTLWQQVVGFLRTAWVLLAIVAGGAAALIVGGHEFWKLTTMDSAQIGGAMGMHGGSSAGVVEGGAVELAAEVQPLGDHVGPAPVQSTDPPERLLLAVPGRVITTRRTYEVGTQVGDDVIARVLLDGVQFRSGAVASWAVVFSSGGNTGKPPGQSGLGTVGGVNTDAAEPGEARVDRDAGGAGLNSSPGRRVLSSAIGLPE
jgi:hypothetical protein